MSMGYIAVAGCTLQLQSGTGDIKITSTASKKVKADGKGVYTEINFDVSNYTGGEITNGDGKGSGSITASAEHVKVEGNAVILEGDESATITLDGTKPGPSGKLPATATDTVKVSDAGQTKVKGA